MKQYAVFMTDLALAPLHGANPRGGHLVETVSLVEAKKTAEDEKGNWDRVIIYQRKADDSLEKVGAYHRNPEGKSPSRYYDFTKR